jgi:hypothetical protein
MITPNLSIQYYGQPFGTSGHYSDFKYVTDGAASSYGSRYTHVPSAWMSPTNDGYQIDEDGDGNPEYDFGKPDFNFGQYRSNTVVRWEYIPGSEIFLVWSQGIDGSGSMRDDLFSSLDEQVLHRKPENIFLIKATYRFVL